MDEIRCIMCGKSSKRWLVIETESSARCLEHFLEAHPVVWPRLGMGISETQQEEEKE